VTTNQTLRAVTTQSFRMPSLYMLRSLAALPVTATLLIPPFTTTALGSQPYAAATGQVKPESVISNELGYVGEFSRLGLRMDVRAFSERVNHRHWIISGDTVNMSGPQIHGIEYQFDWRPFAATRVVFAEAQLREEPGRDAISEHFEAPHRSGSLALYQKLPGGFDLSLMHYYATPYQWATSVLDASRRLDVRLAYAFRVGATKGELAVMFRTPGGSLMDFTPTQLTGRSAFTSLRLDF
jgi:iron complex outermembrane receptor protein